MDPLEQGRKPDCAAGNSRAALGDGAEPGALSRVWLPEIAERIASFLPSNVVACTFRLLDKAAAEQFADCRTIHLSQPSPAWAFAAHWLSPDSCRSLSLDERKDLLALTAASGDVANLRVARQAAGCTLEWYAFYAAIRAGALEACQYLISPEVSFSQLHLGWDAALVCAAESGHTSMVDWCLANGAQLTWTAVAKAYGSGHVALAEKLIPSEAPESDDVNSLVHALVFGCEMAAVPWLWEPGTHAITCPQRPRGLEGVAYLDMATDSALAAAIGSPTPDWKDKAEILLSRGAALAGTCVSSMLPDTDVVPRLIWAKERGLDPSHLMSMANAVTWNNLDAVRWWLGEGGWELPDHPHVSLMWFAAPPMAQQLIEEGIAEPTPLVWRSAIRTGRRGLPLLRWLVEKYGSEVLSREPEGPEDEGIWSMGDVKDGKSAQMMRFLSELGLMGPFEGEDPGMWRIMAREGTEADLEWMAEVGWPRPVDGSPLEIAAHQGDVRTVKVLHRLGLAWGPPKGNVFAAAVKAGVDASALRWMVDGGCPVYRRHLRQAHKRRLVVYGPESSLLPHGIAERIAAFLPSNFVACTFRLLDKSACEQFADRRTILLSQPSPAWAFTAHWLSPDSCRSLSLDERHKLVELTAASGYVPNLRVARQAAGCTLVPFNLHAAVRAGALEACQYLISPEALYPANYLFREYALADAAEGGHTIMIEWCLQVLGAQLNWMAVAKAYESGHVALAMALMPPVAPDPHQLVSFFQGVISGCEMAAVPWLWELVLPAMMRPQGPDGLAPLDSVKNGMLAAAIGSPTPDWEAKVEVLLAKGAALVGPCVIAKLPSDKVVPRLRWAKERGLDPACVMSLPNAVALKNLDAIRWWLGEGVRDLPNELLTGSSLCYTALSTAQLLIEEGLVEPIPRVVMAAIGTGKRGLPLLRWLVEKYGREILSQGAEGEDRWSMEDVKYGKSAQVMRFLSELGLMGPFEGEDPDMWRVMAREGAEADLEWMAEVGWPRPVDGSPLEIAAHQGDIRTVKVLHRLGLAWGPPKGNVFAAAVKAGVDASALRWMVDSGCPVYRRHLRQAHKRRLVVYGPGSSLVPHGWDVL
ncbi:hypothetical protein HYH03_002832 [Edaphochlamys debaryana]|uniref:Ankyrin repeat domain-containing protein n=1 Tax=Edaphochlamys debaryana TaxID=47281 RepID=A0A835YDG4_9CHLO|nr:hypothetical protein HYH03_002832 [Edaphochlamys debaryana]|eukprot:KAG2499253.1 hypothetical protein HYH03_002832 [Edaphochlamys debaryana]